LSPEVAKNNSPMGNIAQCRLSPCKQIGKQFQVKSFQSNSSMNVLAFDNGHYETLDLSHPTKQQDLIFLRIAQIGRLTITPRGSMCGARLAFA
jgi:hypothetical protein